MTYRRDARYASKKHESILLDADPLLLKSKMHNLAVDTTSGICKTKKAKKNSPFIGWIKLEF